MTFPTLSNNHLNGRLHAALTGAAVRYMDNGYMVTNYTPHAEPMYYTTKGHWAPVPDYTGSEMEYALLVLKYDAHSGYRLTLRHNDILWMAMIDETDRFGNIVHTFWAEARTKERALALAVLKHKEGHNE